MSLFDIDWRKPVAVIAVASAVGLGFTMQQEGETTVAYKDSANVWTVGFGHTKGVTRDTKTTHVQNVLYLKQDMAFAEKAVVKYVKVGLYQYEFDALADFVFNVGETKFRKSTLLKVLNNGKYEEVCPQFRRWVYAGGKVVKGLKNRRERECKLFNGQWKG